MPSIARQRVPRILVIRGRTVRSESFRPGDSSRRQHLPRRRSTRWGAPGGGARGRREAETLAAFHPAPERPGGAGPARYSRRDDSRHGCAAVRRTAVRGVRSRRRRTPGRSHGGDIAVRRRRRARVTRGAAKARPGRPGPPVSPSPRRSRPLSFFLFFLFLFLGARVPSRRRPPCAPGRSPAATPPTGERPRGRYGRRVSVVGARLRERCEKAVSTRDPRRDIA